MDAAFPPEAGLVKNQGVPIAVGVMVTSWFVAWQLRLLKVVPDPLVFGYLQSISSLLAFAVATNTLVRFRGTKDRTSLVLAIGFMLSAVVAIRSSMDFFHLATDQGAIAILRTPQVWWESRMLLALILLAALVVEERLSTARYPGLEIAASIAVVAGTSYLLSMVSVRLPDNVAIHPGFTIPRPLHLFPAGVFLLAVIGYHYRLERTDSVFDRGLYWAALLNLGCQLAASQSDRLLDFAFVFAQSLCVAGFAAAFAGSFLDGVRLFDQIQLMAISDPTTGLANNTQMNEVLRKEILRCGRTGRPFSILLMDMDGLKKINDTHGHLVGTRAICRIAETLRQQCRSIDTVARYGGDEFVHILAEASRNDAALVASRFHQRLESSPELPKLSVSIGIANFPTEGNTADELMEAADKDLYRRKAEKKTKAAVGESSGG